MLEKFDAELVWKQILENESLNVFMAVPTIYSKLISHFYSHFPSHSHPQIRDLLRRKFRVMISGSMALPDSVMDQWENISGHVLLERYGLL